MSLLVANLCVTWFLVGLIWVVQVLVYPQFTAVTGECWRAYHAGHMRRITWVVAPAMVAEGLLAAALVAWPPAGVGRGLAVAALVLAVGPWLSTAMWQVPLHNRLAAAGDAAAAGVFARRLTRSNWLRTALWTARGLLLVAIALA
ncbi:MAG: hypothetical protein ACFCVE_12320 [Phycisphaerae bacterium]